jgi:hypothetical protein
MNTITVKIKYNYSVAVAYPICPRAHLLAKIAGTKTLTRDTLENAKKLGFEVIQLAPETLPL